VSGHQTCASASKGCAAACLNFSGNGSYPSVQASRIAKTVAFFTQRQAFLRMLKREIRNAVRLCVRIKKIPVIRLNVMSDLMWEKITPELFTSFPTVRFYDYTKHVERMFGYLAGKLPSNYHLTFSRSEDNVTDCITLLYWGASVTVVFKGKLPDEWNGFRVIDGDRNDLRILDPKNVVVGLKAKGMGRGDVTGFVVRQTALTLPTV
jgi:hypothetical protein